MKRLLLSLALLLAPLAAGAQSVHPTYDYLTLTPRSSTPSPAVNGNCWTQSTGGAGLYCEISGSPVGPYVAAGGTELIVGSTPITGGAAGRVVYDNGGLFGEYTATQLTAQIAAFTSSLSGAAPASGGGTANFLRADGTWAAPAGTSVTIGTTTISGGTAPCAVENSTGTTSACLAISASGATASTLAERDANANLSANNYFASGTKTSAGGAPVVLTAASTQAQIITGSGSQTFTLPDATTLPLGPVFLFNNNSSGTTTINNAGSSLVYSLPAGGEVTVGLTDNGSTNGTWDAHPRPPATVQWGSGTTGLVMNSALSTTPQINAGASSSTVPALLPQRGSSTTGFGGDSTHLYGIIGGAAVLTQSAAGSTLGSPTGGAEGAGTLNTAGLFVNGTAVSTTTGTVTTSGSPASGNLTKFSGATAITNGDLSGDCTTSGTLAITCLKTNGSSFGTSATVNTGTSGATIPLLNGKNTYSASQAGSITTLAISTATFTPDGSNNHYYVLLVHASCPCTLANPSPSFVAGTTGVIEIQQSASGSDTIGTWGSSYEAPGGTSTIVLSTGANAVDILAYYVIDSTHILLIPSTNFSH